MTMLFIDQTPAPAIAPVAQTPQAVQTTPAAVAGQSVEALRTQLGDLNVQLAGQRAQWNGLQEQINSMLKSNPARPAVVAKWADVGVQIAQTEGDVARVQAQLAQKQGTPVTGFPGAPPARGTGVNVNVDKITEMSFVLMLAVILPTSFAWARRVWRGKPAPQRDARDDAAGSRRMERMEHAIDAIAIEVERVSEGQRFVTKVLAERMPLAQAKSSVDAPVESEPRALGAGAIEPVRVGEREAVPLSSRPF